MVDVDIAKNLHDCVSNVCLYTYIWRIVLTKKMRVLYKNRETNRFSEICADSLLMCFFFVFSDL